ncbi:MAG: hypothetical protein ACHQET_10880 [Chitinophagales bacterium]
MFISVRYLHNNLGVDETIARFFVDRKVPQDSSFWKNRLLYVGRGNGYISIPVYYDLLFRIGLPRELLLDESHVHFMEQLMHYAILVEFKEIIFPFQLQKIKELLIDRIKDQAFFDELFEYLSQPVLEPSGRLGMPVPSLNRADVFLFILCDLPMTESQIEQAIEYWYALHTSYLLMDDIYDYKMDQQDKEENSVIELGAAQDGFERAFALLDHNIKKLTTINPSLSQNFEESLEGLHELIQ